MIGLATVTFPGGACVKGEDHGEAQAIFTLDGQPTGEFIVKSTSYTPSMVRTVPILWLSGVESLLNEKYVFPLETSMGHTLTAEASDDCEGSAQFTVDSVAIDVLSTG
jgi:hypothetical protein